MLEARVHESTPLVPPVPPANIERTGIDPHVLSDLALKAAFLMPRLSTESAAETLCLPLNVTAELLEGLRKDCFLEALRKSGPFGFFYAITELGRERAKRLLELSGYVGPAPVSIATYTSELERQVQGQRQPTCQEVDSAIADIVLTDEARRIAGVALMSGRSLFISGPPGNGKTTLSFELHNALQGSIWIPYCMAIDHEIIRVFDPQVHQIDSTLQAHSHDKRWIPIKRPFVVVGGELTIEALDLIYDRQLGYYQSPLHFKANGGTFLIDDFGCQRVQPQELLNRWIHPLESGNDYLTLKTGQQFRVPFRQMIIVSTNQDPASIMSPAFLRRIGYRLYLGNPSVDEYKQIFQRYALRSGLGCPVEVVDGLIERYCIEQRPRRGCEPRDLIERARDVCTYLGQPVELSTKTLDLAWRGYFGQDVEVPLDADSKGPGTLGTLT